MNTQEIYDNMIKVSRKNTVKYIVVTKLVIEFNMCRYNIEDRLQAKSLEKGTNMKHINVLQKALEANTKNSIGYVAQT